MLYRNIILGRTLKTDIKKCKYFLSKSRKKNYFLNFYLAFYCFAFLPLTHTPCTPFTSSFFFCTLKLCSKLFCLVQKLAKNAFFAFSDAVPFIYTGLSDVESLHFQSFSCFTPSVPVFISTADVSCFSLFTGVFLASSVLTSIA